MRCSCLFLALFYPGALWLWLCVMGAGMHVLLDIFQQQSLVNAASLWQRSLPGLWSYNSAVQLIKWHGAKCPKGKIRRGCMPAGCTKASHRLRRPYLPITPCTHDFPHCCSRYPWPTSLQLLLHYAPMRALPGARVVGKSRGEVGGGGGTETPAAIAARTAAQHESGGLQLYAS